MYNLPPFKESDLDKCAALMHAYPFANLITQSTRSAEGHSLEVHSFEVHPFEVQSLPLILDSSKSTWTLQGHIARANTFWQHAHETQCMAIFQGPQHYISPAWYPGKEASGGKVVPTWNYVAVQVHGILRFTEDSAWLLQHIEQLTRIHEARVQESWSIADAPHNFIQKMTRAIVGVEISITHVEGKWKISQNRSNSDKLGVAAALQKLNNDNALAVSELVLESAHD